MVAVTLFAPPVEVSGTFDFGYKITFDPVAALKDNSNYSTFVSVTSDY